MTISASVTVNNPDTGNHVLTATAVSARPGQQLPGRRDRTRLHPGHRRADPGLSDRQDRRHDGTVPGGTVGYTITVTNTGQTAYAGATVTDSFARSADDAAYNDDATATAGVAVATPRRC